MNQHSTKMTIIQWPKHVDVESIVVNMFYLFYFEATNSMCLCTMFSLLFLYFLYHRCFSLTQQIRIGNRNTVLDWNTWSQLHTHCLHNHKIFCSIRFHESYLVFMLKWNFTIEVYNFYPAASLFCSYKNNAFRIYYSYILPIHIWYECM